MRTNIEIDDALMKKAMKASGLEHKTKKAVVEEALQSMVRMRAREDIWKYFGKVEWDDGLAGMPEKDKWAEAEQRDREFEELEKRKTARRTRKKAA